MNQPKRWQMPFFSIWVGQAFSLVGSRLVQFSLVWWLTQETGSATVLTLATLVAILPTVLLGPFAGALVDRWDRRKVMIAADLFVALVSAWLAVLFWNGSLAVWHVYLAMLARAVGESFHWPAMQASTSLMVPKEHLSRVAGLNQMIQGALSIAAPPLGALALIALPLFGIMAIDIATALLAVVPLLFVAIPRPERVMAGPAGARPASAWHDFKAGLRYAAGWPGLVVVLGIGMFINFVVNPAFALMPLLVTDHFGGGAAEFAGLEAAWGAGMLAGALLLSVWGGFKRRVYTSLLAMIVAGLSVMVVGLVPPDGFAWALLAMGLAGAMNPLINGPLFAILQATVAPDMQGRIFTLVTSMATAMMPVSLAVAGPLADVVGVQPWYVAGGLLFALVGGLGFFVRPLVNLEKSGYPGQPLLPADEATAPVAGE